MTQHFHYKETLTHNAPSSKTFKRELVEEEHEDWDDVPSAQEFVAGLNANACSQVKGKKFEQAEQRLYERFLRRGEFVH